MVHNLEAGREDCIAHDHTSSGRAGRRRSLSRGARRARPDPGARARRVLRAAAAAYLLIPLGLLAMVYGPGEAWWPITLFLFGPRWLVALPLVVLALVALLVDRRLLLVLVVAGVAFAEPLLGFGVPWRQPWSAGGTGEGPTLRVATWNVGGGSITSGDLRTFLESERPDILVLQECRDPLLDQPGDWHRHGEAGMCLLSRFPILEVAARDPGDVWAMAGSGAIVRYVLDTPAGRVDLTSLHLETPREGLEALLDSGPSGAAVLEAKNEQRAIEHRLSRRWVDASPGPLRIVAGDLNTPVESNLFREYWGGFQDCHSAAGWGFGFTKHTRRIGVRIDHVMVAPGWVCVATHVSGGRGGDHDPVVAVLRPR